MASNRSDLTGLSSDEAVLRQLKYGKNELSSEKKESFLRKIWHIICEPMFLLLIIAATIYFILGEARDALTMLVFVVVMISIGVIQELKTDKTLNALKSLSAPHVNVIRDGIEIQIESLDLVPGDLMLIQEGLKIPADGFIVKCNDLAVDESTLSGESEAVWKTLPENSADDSGYWRKDYCYAGTLISQGSALVRVDKIGEATEYGRIGKLALAPEEKTPLQKQIVKIIQLFMGVAALFLILVSVVTWFNLPDHFFGERLVESILSGITLAMAMIPEEFPVVLTVFLSLGAWRLARKNSLIRKLPSVETLGAISVLCVDKTGTITLNQMTVQEIWAADDNEENLIEMMGLACETEAYDPMEKAMLAYCENSGISKGHLFEGQLLNEYAFTSELKMMGHVWRHEGEIIIAAKGSPEGLLKICRLKDEEADWVESNIQRMSAEGLRVIAVAAAKLANESQIPPALTDCSLNLCGLIGLADPPRESVKNDIAVCEKAGIRVVMITGDNGITAAAIAQKIGMKDHAGIITGDMLAQMSEGELREKVKTVSIFSRVIPEHKMRIVKAFRDNGDIVAMTGDGVNDAPALKYADIGIAMGKRGSEVSREAADLILLDDNFSTIVDTVKDGRRIYDNIRKAVGYIFTIHIPIALASLLAPLLNILPDSLMFLPLHIVLLELVIDPTCSIVLERQPAETDIMERRPRNPQKGLISAGSLGKSIIQGLVIFAASFGIYYYTLAQNPEAAPAARSMGLAVIMLANLFLVQVNSSDRDSFLVSGKRLAKDKIMWAVNIITLLALLIILYTPLNEFLKLGSLSAAQILTVLCLAAVSVLWYEAVKAVKRARGLI